MAVESCDVQVNSVTLMKVDLTLRESPPNRVGEVSSATWFSAPAADWIAQMGRPVTYRFRLLNRLGEPVDIDLPPGASGSRNVPAGYYLNDDGGGIQFWEV